MTDRVEPLDANRHGTPIEEESIMISNDGSQRRSSARLVRAPHRRRSRRGDPASPPARRRAAATPSPSAVDGRPIGQRRVGERRPRARPRRPDCGTDPVVLNAYFETGFDIPFKLSEEFTKQFPNVTWDIKQDQFTNLMTATPRLLSGDNPPDLIRLPSMVSLVKDGLLKNLDELRDGVRLGQVAGRPARPEPGRRGRDARVGLALRDGPQLQPDRRLLQQGAGRADRHDRAAGDGRRVRGAARQGQGRRPPADHGVERHGERRRARIPAPEPDGRLRSDASRSTTGSSRSPARRSTRPTNLTAAQHLQQWVKAGYFPEDANAIEYTDANARFGKGEGVFMFNGDWQNATYDKDMPGNVGFFLFPPGGGRRHASPRCRRR